MIEKCCRFRYTTDGPITQNEWSGVAFLTVFINKFIVNQNYSKNILKLVK
jgi:hypothetical protein